jgi:hypothetical protein
MLAHDGIVYNPVTAIGTGGQHDLVVIRSYAWRELLALPWYLTWSPTRYLSLPLSLARPNRARWQAQAGEHGLFFLR